MRPAGRATSTRSACTPTPPATSTRRSRFLRDNDGQIDEDSFIGYREVHATEVANGDDVPIWMTEMSWRTTSRSAAKARSPGRSPRV